MCTQQRSISVAKRGKRWCCLQAYELRGAGAVLHSHSINAVMATLLQQHKGKGCAGEFKVTNLEMIKASSRNP